jgi:hypothetical protein
VRARLLNLANERNQPFDLLLTHFAHECFLYRLSISPHRQRFVLRGATLMTAWSDGPHRPARDLDLARARRRALIDRAGGSGRRAQEIRVGSTVPDSSPRSFVMARVRMTDVR